MISRGLTVTTPSAREVAMSRVFDAPRELVFAAYTRPALVRRWLGALDGWTMPVCEIDLRVGGAYRFVWRGPDGTDMGMGGIYREIVPAERVVATEQYEHAWYPGGALSTVQLVESAGQTTLTMTILYDSKEARDAVLKSPMKDGVAAGFTKLDAVLSQRLEVGAQVE